MDNTIITLLTIFTGIVALVLLIQGIALLVLYRRVNETMARIEARSAKASSRIDDIAGKIDDFISVIKSTAEKVESAQQSLTAMTGVVQRRVVEVDAFLGEATDAARLQIARFQDTIETASARIEETIEILQSAITVPVSEVTAIVRGIRIGFDTLFGRRRPPQGRSHQDEEMFI